MAHIMTESWLTIYGNRKNAPKDHSTKYSESHLEKQLGALIQKNEEIRNKASSMSYQHQHPSELNMDAGGAVAAAYIPTGSARHGHHNHATAHSGNADPNTLISQFSGMAIGGMGMANNPGPVSMGPGHAFVVGSDGQFMLAPVSAQHVGLGNSNENMYQNFSMPPAGYSGQYVGVGMGMSVPLVPFTPGRVAPAHARLERHSDVPALENRRGSYSTTESTPTTPFYGATQRDGTRVASLDRSAYTTPSPQQLGLSALHNDPPKVVLSAVSERTLEELVKKEPAIPKAVPAVFTPPGQMKSLDQSLDNRIPGNRNVYIRGLHPTTDDELLYHFASRFGPVETSKAIIDTGTGACKG